MNQEDSTPSRTYKIKTPSTEHAIYFTIVGDPDPVAFFVNSKEMGAFQWITALMASYSQQIEDGKPAASIAKDMTGVFDPNGSYIIPDGSGRKVNSLVHHMGLILEEHIDDGTS